MDFHSNLEYLCRVCAANTKYKNSDLPECVYILKTPGLRDKLDKFLYLKVSLFLIIDISICGFVCNRFQLNSFGEQHQIINQCIFLYCLLFCSLTFDYNTFEKHTHSLTIRDDGSMHSATLVQGCQLVFFFKYAIEYDASMANIDDR